MNYSFKLVFAILFSIWPCVSSYAQTGISQSSLNYKTVQDEKGQILRYSRTNTGYLLVLTPGQELLTSLAAFQKAMKFSFATATGIGNVSNIRLGKYNMQTKTMSQSRIFSGAHEVTSLVCNLTMLVDESGESRPLPHCHISMAPTSSGGYQLIGGHLITATIAVVGEIYINTAKTSGRVVKTHDSYFNGDAFDLNSLV